MDLKSAGPGLHPSALSLLEFHQLLLIISGFSNSEASRKAVLAIVPFKNREDIIKRQGLVREIMRMAEEGSALRLTSFSEISHLISKSKPDGAVLEAAELSAFTPLLEISSEVSSQIRSKDDLPFLGELTGGLTGFPELLRLLKKSVDSEGNILDSASALLSDLREQIRRLDTRIRKKLEEMVRDEKISVFLQDDFVTKRSGRWVIPVRMDSKGQVAGVVHDISKSGETAFIEPLSMINLSNELENLIAEQKAEEIRILRKISALIRQEADGIRAEYDTIVLLDTINSIAKFAGRLGLQLPLINTSGTISLAGGMHPLLLLAFQKSGKGQRVVPLEVRLGVGDTIMVITGSNAGGKTIAIKTIGLLLLMAMSGMPVPADSASDFPLVENLLVDIGDEQSIENSLSTFSAHISNISGILKNAGPKSLVLIDELGTGTDPDEGAALACAVLRELKGSKALVFATTHLADIKGFVHRTEGMLNASMEFDQKTLTPLFRLRIGEPGQSHALETARRYGLPESIIDSAKAMLGGVKIEFDNLIADLNQKRASYESALVEITKERQELEEKTKLAGEMLSAAEDRQKEILSKAYQEAADVVLNIKRQLNSLLEEARKREKAPGQKELRDLIKKAGTKDREISERLKEYETDASGSIPIDAIKEGDVVFVRSLGYDASVVKVMKVQNRIRVRTGSMEIELPADDIRTGKGRKLEAKKSDFQTGGPDEMTPSRLNLVGLRVDEALSRLEPFLNHASLAGFSEVTIIHGFGTGILARAVRGYLEGHPLVKKFRAGDKSEGGGGVTVATLS